MEICRHKLKAVCSYMGSDPPQFVCKISISRSGHMMSGQTMHIVILFISREANI